MKDSSLKTRIIVLVSILVVAFLGVTIFTQYSLNKFKKNNTVKDEVRDLEVLVLQLRRNEKDFLARSIKDPGFYNNEENKYLKSFAEEISKAERITKHFKESKFIENDIQLSAKVDSMFQLFVTYQSDFNLIANNYKELGFKDWD